MRFLSMAHNVNVNAQLRETGFEVTTIEYDMFALEMEVFTVPAMSCVECSLYI